jgi:hypothetical protein
MKTMKHIQETDDMYLSRLLNAVLEFYIENGDYPDALYLRPDEYEWVREKFNVLDRITLGHVTVKIWLES